jgi:hypothetical protein
VEPFWPSPLELLEDTARLVDLLGFTLDPQPSIARCEFHFQRVFQLL